MHLGVLVRCMGWSRYNCTASEALCRNKPLSPGVFDPFRRRKAAGGRLRLFSFDEGHFPPDPRSRAGTGCSAAAYGAAPVAEDREGIPLVAEAILCKVAALCSGKALVQPRGHAGRDWDVLGNGAVGVVGHAEHDCAATWVGAVMLRCKRSVMKSGGKQKRSANCGALRGYWISRAYRSVPCPG